MQILLLCLCLASFIYISSALSWFTATLDTNNNTLYVIGDGGGNALPRYNSPKPLFIVTNESDQYYSAVVGANGAKALSLSDDGRLYVATESCVLAVLGLGSKVQIVAGDCMEGGRRNGPLMYARFMSLTAISTDPSFFCMAILDSGRANNNNVLLANSWSVREIGQVLGAFDLSLVVERKGKQEEEFVEESIAVLVLTPLSAILIVGKDDDNRDGNNGSIISSNWKQYPMLSDMEAGRFTACLLQGGDSKAIMMIENLTYTAYIMDEGGTLWVSLLLSSVDNVAETRVYKTTKIAASVNRISKLIWGKDGTALLKGLDIQNKRFVSIDFNGENGNNTVNNTNNNTNNSIDICTKPWQVPACDVGYIIIENQTCIPSPPGGYFIGSEFVQCPKGTYNPSPMAGSYLACKKCDPGFIAPLKGSVVCSACNESFGWQSESGDQCLSKCPLWSQDTEAFICKPCLPGSSFNNKDKKCQPCPAKTSSVMGGQCLPCSANTSSPEGSAFCYKTCPLPNTCSNNGIRRCVAWKPPYLVSTIANLQNLPGKFLSLAISSNGTIFTGNNQGVLVIFMVGGANHIQKTLHGVKTLDAMTLSVDEKYLFIADKGSGMVIKVANLGSEISILARNVTPQSICATVDGLYIVDGLSNSILLLGQVVWEGSAPMLLLSATIHEDKRSLVVLGNSTKLISIWRLSRSSNNYNNTSATFDVLPLSFITSAIPMMPWISRWEKGKSTICIGHAIVNIADSEVPLTFSKNSTQQANNEWEIVAGSEDKAGHQDDEGQASRFMSPIAAAPLILLSNNEGPLLFLMEDQTSTIRTVYLRPCECLPDFYMLNGTCLPCLQQTHSMSGSRGCSICPSGEYLDKNGHCIVCPVTFWWNDKTYDPCRKMQGTSSNKNMMIGLTLFEAQEWVANNGGGEGLDIISTATILIPNLNEIPPADILIRGDLLGRLWNIDQSMTPKPFDPQGISIQAIPGIWALCSPVVFSGEECNCWHTYLRLGYDEIYPLWRESREQAEALAGNITHKSIFVLRPDDLYTTPPILVVVAGGSIRLNPQKTPVGDLGLCFVGWPAQYNCTDPNFVWTFPSEQYPGGACLPCPTGTIAETHSSVKCLAIDDKNPLCNPGTYKTFVSFSSSYTCKICPENSYSTSQGAIQCKPKVILTCLPGFYVSDGGPTSDNTCELCIPCAVDSVMMPFLSNPCPGNTKSQPYFCVSWMQAVPGFFASVILGKTDNLVKYNPCKNLPPYAVWDNGPYHDLCYFRCKFNVNEAMVREYAFYFALGSSERWPGGGDKNLFPYQPPLTYMSGNQENVDRAMAAICSACNTSTCPTGMWRPLWADGCGPPCLISPNLCQGRSDGCVAICDISKNAVVVGFGTDEQGRAICIWRCNIGWIKIREGGESKCAACNASLCEAGEKYVGNSQCSPEMLLSELCIPCPATASEGGVLNVNSSQRGKCSYTCVDGYPNPNPLQQGLVACIQCAASVTRCPAGFSVTCALNPCRQCQNPNTLSGRAVLVPTGDSICRVQCRPGFHTISIKDFSVITSLAIIGHDPSQILCDECSKWQGLACPTLSCSPGYQQNKKLGICTPCQTSTEMGCQEGTYAPPCPGGGGVTQVGWCLTCPMHLLLVANAANDVVPGQWPTRKFVPYAVRTSGVTFSANGNDDCPTACVDGSVQVKTATSSIIICVACSSMLPAPPEHAPYKRYSSSWNASDGIRWWTPEFDPPHLSSQKMSWFGNTIQMEKRAGVCWPCPPLPLMGDPCYSGQTDQSYGLDGGGILFVDELLPKPQQFAWAGGGRRLLAESRGLAELMMSCKPGSYPTGSWCSACPPDHYCIGGISQPVRCGAFFSAAPGSQSAQNCTCRPGFALLNQGTMECVLLNLVFDCPPGYYKSPNSFQDKGPSLSPCIACPRGTYEVNGMCQDCPLQSYSTEEGSIQCTCLGGRQIIVLSSENLKNKCQTSCTIGSSSFDGSKCQKCTVGMAMVMPFPLTPCSCGPGTYYLQNRCEPCPKGTFSQAAGYAPCIACPEKMTTLYTGASTLASCIFLEISR